MALGSGTLLSRSVSNATGEYSAARHRTQWRPGSSAAHPKPLMAPLSDLNHSSVELGGGHIEPVGRDDVAVDAHSPLLDQAPRLAAAEIELLGQQRRQVDSAVSRD